MIRRNTLGWMIASAAFTFSVLATFAAILNPTPACASAQQVGGQAPGFYRMHIGRFEVTAMLDGTHPFQAERFAVGAKPGQVNALLGEQLLKSPFEGMINAFVVNTGDRLILIDAGAGNLYGKDGGGLVAALKASGYSPDQIDDVFITHLHEDHAGGVMLDGKPVFPNAMIHVSKRDSDFWLDNRNQDSVGSLLKPFFPAIQKVVAPYIAAGRFKTFEGDAPLLPGLRPLAAPGHTPGHTYYLLQEGGQSILFWGDTVHMQPVQMPDPDIAIEYDWDVPSAIAARKSALALASKNGWWVAGAHISFPGIGHVLAEGAGYRWIPTNYTLNR